MPTRAVAVAIVALASIVGARPLLPKPHHGGFQMKMGRFVIHPGQDRETCQYRRLPNRKPFEATAFEIAMRPLGHHFVLWAYTGNVADDARFPTGMVDSPGCVGLSPSDSPVLVDLFGLQTARARVSFPPGIAVALRPRQQVFLNAHLKNFGTTDVVPQVRINLWPAKKGTVQHHAEYLIVGNAGDIAVPAGGDQTLTSEWIAPADLNVIMLSTHQHRLGTDAQVALPQPGGGWAAVVDNADWEHPSEMWTHLTPPYKDLPTPVIRVQAGERIRFTCKWHNTDDHTVRFGVKTTDEMCFMTGYYYRDDETRPISAPGCLPQASGLLCFAPKVASE